MHKDTHARAMYHDSDDEPLSGDEEEERRTSAIPKRRKNKTLSSKKETTTPDDWKRVEAHGANITNNAVISKCKQQRRKSSASFKGFNIYPVIVVDYDLTLVDRSSRPFHGSHEFIERLRQFNDGQNQLILYSHGSPAYINEGLNKHYERERKYFDLIISDSSARENKPISQVRRVIKKLDYLIGPYVIIDDMRSNLDSDQYDVVIDITRMTKYDTDGRAVSVDYSTCLCVLDQGVQAFLNTKTKSSDR